MIRAIIFAGFGINCERETAAGLRMAGASADIVHLNRLFSDSSLLDQADIVVFPGGFSFGDRLGGGQALANRLRHRRAAGGGSLISRLTRFIDAGGLVLGICNGFQVLVKLGLLPNLCGGHTQEVALAANASRRYENRWCRLAPTSGGPAGDFGALGLLELPVRHGEGRVVFGSDATRTSVVDQSLNWLTYANANGAPATRFPENPNGADLACAGLTDPTGRVLGLMPHPEAFTSPYLHYAWSRRQRDAGALPEADGLRLLRHIVRLTAKPLEVNSRAAKEAM